MHQLAEQLKRDWLSAQTGQMVDVLWERRKEEVGRVFYSGYTPNYCKVLLKADPVTPLENRITPVNLVALDTQELVLQGELL